MEQIAFTRTYKEYAPFMVVTEVKVPEPYQGSFGTATHYVTLQNKVLDSYDYWPDARDDAKRRFEEQKKATLVWVLVKADVSPYPAPLTWEVTSVYSSEEKAKKAVEKKVKHGEIWFITSKLIDEGDSK